MSLFRIAQARRFIASAMEAPLFERVGEPFDDPSVSRVKTVAQYARAMRSPAWDNVSNHTLNHHAARIIDVYGMAWFQKRNNKSVQLVWDEIDKTPLRKSINAAWKRLGLPDVIDPFIDTKTWAYNFFAGIAFDHALGFGPEDSFERGYVEPWLLRGHLPCGWKGRVPPEPKVPVGVLPYAGVTLQEAIGDGRLVVF